MSHFVAPNERTICLRKADLKYPLKISVQKPPELGQPEFRQSTNSSHHLGQKVKVEFSEKQNCPLISTGNETEEL